MRRSQLVLSLALLFGLFAIPARAQDPPRIRPIEKRLLGQAFRISENPGNQVWKKWDKAPKAVLLITPEYEFLLRHPKPAPDFDLSEKDATLGRIYYRKRVYAPNLLATFPAVGGVSTIVVGLPENTNVKNEARWVLTVIHEHFHQLQDSQKGIFAEIETLGLARGDTTGMWMLNFPFPYDNPEVNKEFSALCQALAGALKAEKNEFGAQLAIYLQARERFRNILSPDDYKYFSFQVWKEGVARYTELIVAARQAGRLRWQVTMFDVFLGSSTKPDFSQAIGAYFLGDGKAYEEASRDLGEGIVGKLPELSLKDQGRVAFYSFGAAEALLLDRANPNWQKQYFAKKFFLERYFPAR
jgi:hypothetical protein